jgi:hypothetical protein
MFYVYGLRLQWEDEYRYVGSTADPDARFLSHFYDAERRPTKGNRELKRWLAENGRECVVMDVLEEIESGDRRAVEQSWIARLAGDDNRLFNIRAADTSTEIFSSLPAEHRTAIVSQYLDAFEKDTDEPWFKEPEPVYLV